MPGRLTTVKRLLRRGRSEGTPGFFDRFPRFQQTSHTSPGVHLLNLRHKAIFGSHGEVLAGARVLDIASHDGRWSLAALEAGAVSVVGIEARPELVANATDNLAHYGYGADRVDFVAGDVFTVLAEQSFDVDVVLCLGFLYHTLRYNELLAGIRAAGPRHVIIDTEVLGGREGPLIRLRLEPSAREGNAVADEYTTGSHVLTGRPTPAGLDLMARAYGFVPDGHTDWAALLEAHPEVAGMNDYRRGGRVTVRWRADHPAD